MEELQAFVQAVVKNLFQPLLLFFYMGFVIPILRVGFDFPHVIYQGLTMYLLIAIGWHGGEELGKIYQSNPQEFYQAGGFMVVGFIVNFFIGILAFILRAFTKLRRVDAATVAAYYGSDSAGTFATCVGVLGSLIATQLVLAKTDTLKETSLNLDPHVVSQVIEIGPNKEKLVKDAKLTPEQAAEVVTALEKGEEIGQDKAKPFHSAAYMPVMLAVMEIPGCLVGLYLVSRLRQKGMDRRGNMPDEPGYDPSAPPSELAAGGHGHHETKHEKHGGGEHASPPGILSWQMMHEVFLNPGLYLLFGGIAIGFIGQLQGSDVVKKDDPFLVTLFHGVLCLFLLEMGMTASKRIKDLHAAGPAFIAYGLIAPNLFATIGLIAAHCYSMAIHQPFDIGTYALFAVLCGASSYIAVPAVQRMAIPEASPTLPLAASLGLTFSYNVTIGIQVYILIAQKLNEHWPVVSS